MLKLFKQTILYLLVMVIILGCVSCNKTDNTNDNVNTDSTTEVEAENTTADSTTEGEAENTTTDSTTEEIIPRVDKIDVKLDGNYANIRVNYNINSSLLDEVKSFASSYAKIVDVQSLAPKKSGSYDADMAEILVGNVGFPESDEVYKTLKYNEVKVRVVGNKLVVAGCDPKTMANAFTKILEMLEEKQDPNGNICLDGDFVIDMTFGAPLSVLPVLKGLNPTTYVDTGDDCHMLNFGRVEKDVFAAYCNNIAAEGFTLYAEKDIEGNIYKTYTDDKYVVTAIYTPRNGFAKVLSQPLSATALPTKEEDNKYTPVANCDTTITQVGLLNDNLARTYNGMCYIIRLADGSFIVVDGGFSLEGYKDRIYNILKKQAPNPNEIVIAAWIITHAHDDHVNVFESFFESYADKLTVERFICNLPSSDQLVNNWANEKQGNIRYTENFRNFLNTSVANVPKIKAHPGQEFYIRNAKINILFTLDVYDKTFDDYNNSSVVFKFEAEGKSMLFLGDHDDGGALLSKTYGKSTLKSDIVQVAHHGLPENSSNAICRVIDPDYAFWPAGAKVVKGNVDLFAVQANKYIVALGEDKIFLAEDNVYVFTLKDCSCKKYETVAEYLSS